jgi:8-oxo-dGTP pyrophosphatase MutT (NUDIX family)
MVNVPTRQPNLDDLYCALGRPLPGLEAQLRMSPDYRAKALRERRPPADHKQAGVLILLYPRDGQLYFPLTRRTETVKDHKGQISLPGGAREGNESLQQTALRETREELGVPPDHLDVLGRLTPLYVPPSHFLISPFVAYSATRPAFDPDPVEVAALIETPLALLLDPKTEVWEEWEIRGKPVQVPFFRVLHEENKVWGATAMILSELAVALSNNHEKCADTSYTVTDETHSQSHE